MHVITEDQRNEDVLYAGTEFGVFVSIDRGTTWSRLRAGLPTVPVYAITMHPRENDLIIGTFGRGVWILDDASPIQEAAKALRADAHLVAPRRAIQFNRAHDKWWMWGDRRFWGENPPFGAGIAFHLSAPARDVVLTVRDAAGAVVRTMRHDEVVAEARAGRARPGAGAAATQPTATSPSREAPAGLHRLHWNLRYDPLPAPVSQRLAPDVVPYFSGAQAKAHSYRDIRRDELDPLAAPFVPPGRFTVTLTVDGRDRGTVPFEVEADPLLRISPADRQTWHDAARAVHDVQRVAYKAGDRFAALEQQVRIAATAAGTGGPLASRVEALSRRTGLLRLKLALPPPGGLGGDAGLRITNVPGRLASLKSQLLGASALPTAVQRQQFADAQAGLRDATVEANALRDELTAVVAALRASRVPVPALDPLPPFASFAP